MDQQLKKNIKHQFFHYALPSVMAMWVYTIYTMVDGMFVANGVGITALAAVNIAMPMINTAFALGILFAVGASTRASYYKGQGDPHRASEVFTTSTVTVFVLAIIVSLLVSFNMDAVVRLLGADEDTHQYVKDYLHIIVAFIPCYMTAYNMEVLIKADGHPKKAIATTSVGAVTNIFLDWLFVMVFHWGIKGAAIATGIAQVTAFVIFFTHFARNKTGFTFVKFRWRLREVLHFAKVGIADAVTEFSVGVIIFSFNNVLLHISGNNGIAIYTVIAYVSQLILMTMMGINQGMQPLVSFYYGQNKPTVYRYILRVALVTAGVASFIAFALGMFWPQPIVALFINPSLDHALYLEGLTAFRLFSFSFLPLGCVVILYGYFTALELSRQAMAISISRGLVLVLIALAVMAYCFGETGVWLSMTVSETLSLVLAVTLFYFTFRRKRKTRLPL